MDSLTGTSNCSLQSFNESTNIYRREKVSASSKEVDPPHIVLGQLGQYVVDSPSDHIMDAQGYGPKLETVGGTPGLLAKM